MLGLKLKSWMEAHIVRSRKKQSKKGKNSEKNQISPSRQDEENVSKESNAHGTISKENSAHSVGYGQGNHPSMTSDKSNDHLSTDLSKINLSSPESAYSTGYSTDGTSPGVSVPPEYYINLRTGKHYIQASTGNTGASGSETVAPCATGELVVSKKPVAPSPILPANEQINVNLTPSSARLWREEAFKKKKTEAPLLESSTEEDFNNLSSQQSCSAKVQQERKPNNCVLSHRRTESYDENNHYRVQLHLYSSICQESEGSISPQIPGVSTSTCTQNTAPNAVHQCGSPFLTSTASPRQRNRIRTNPWLGGPSGSSVQLSLEAELNNHLSQVKSSSQGETSSTNGSSCASSSAVRVEASASSSTSGPCSPRPPPAVDLIRIIRGGSSLVSPLLNGNRVEVGTTTGSPLSQRQCRRFRGQQEIGGQSNSSVLSLSSSATPSSDEDVNLHRRQRYRPLHPSGNNSSSSSPIPCDASEDNSALTKGQRYEGSYIREKETDILSDSDPTDNDINGKCCYEARGLERLEPATKLKRRIRCRRMKIENLRASGGGSNNEATHNIKDSARRKSHTGLNVSTPTRKSRRKSVYPLHTYDEVRHVPNGYQEQSPLMSSRPILHVQSPNLNRLLMEKLMTGSSRIAPPIPPTPGQRLGSRSADCTPVSLRKHCTSGCHPRLHSHHHHRLPHREHHGKYLKNPNISKLMSNSNCSSPSKEVKYSRGGSFSPICEKRRSNSLSMSGGGYISGNVSPYYAPVAPPPSRAIDNDGDLKYQCLMKEAENLVGNKAKLLHRRPIAQYPCSSSPFHKPYSSQNKFVISPLPPRYPVYNPEIESFINNNPPSQSLTAPKTKTESEDQNFLKKLSKTLEKIIIRNTKDKKSKITLPKEEVRPYNDVPSRQSGGKYTDYEGYAVVRFQPEQSNNNNNDQGCYISNVVESLQASSLSNNLVSRDKNDNMFPTPTFTTFGHRINTNEPKVKNEPMAETRGSHNTQTPNRKLGLSLWKEGGHLSSSKREKFTRKDEAVSTPRTPLVAYEMFKLIGKPAAAVNEQSYSPPKALLPHSEPVKRKVYACSSSFERLRKSWMVRGDLDPSVLASPEGLDRKFQPKPPEEAIISTKALREENLSLKEKVEQLRRQRIEVEERVRNTQAQIDRLRAVDTSNSQFLPFSERSTTDDQ